MSSQSAGVRDVPDSSLFSHSSSFAPVEELLLLWLAPAVAWLDDDGAGVTIGGEAVMLRL